jgi:hypothetical protein
MTTKEIQMKLIEELIKGEIYACNRFKSRPKGSC